VSELIGEYVHPSLVSAQWREVARRVVKEPRVVQTGKYERVLFVEHNHSFFVHLLTDSKNGW
jgi:hypothetical protein